MAIRIDPKTIEALYRDALKFNIQPGFANTTNDELKYNSARENAAVLATGELYPCIATLMRAGSILEGCFGQIWNDSPLFHWNRGLRAADFKT